ncbi:MAG: lycopene cyclase domain-containing protein [Candidatus Paceibacterota bacterium]|jgi:hypothetical protein
MVLIGLLLMIGAPFAEQMHFTDWWHPHFIFNSFITIEDLLFGFSVGGVISAVYSLLNSRIKDDFILPINLTGKILTTTAFLFSVFGLFYIFHIHSFISSIIALSIPVIIVGYYNKKSLIPIFLTGMFMTVFALAGYLFSIYLNPNFVKETYLLNHLSKILILGIPIEELLWFFFAGMGVSAFQKIIWSEK